MGSDEISAACLCIQDISCMCVQTRYQLHLGSDEISTAFECRREAVRMLVIGTAKNNQISSCRKILQNLPHIILMINIINIYFQLSDNNWQISCYVIGLPLSKEINFFYFQIFILFTTIYYLKLKIIIQVHKKNFFVTDLKYCSILTINLCLCTILFHKPINLNNVTKQ